MPTLINGKVTYQSNEALPAQGTEAFKQAQSGVIPTSPINQTFDGSALGSATPIVVPTINSTPRMGPTVTAPIGTAMDDGGNASIVPKEAPVQEKSRSDKILDELKSLGGLLGDKSKVTQELQKEQELAQKTERATVSYNTYNKKKLEFQQKLEQMQSAEANTVGAVGGGYASSIRKFEREGNAELANLAIVAQADQGLLTAAEKTIKDKISAQFEPITEQIDYFSKLLTASNNDLSESEKFKMQQDNERRKSELETVNRTADTINQTILKNGAPASVYSAIDKVASDYAEGKITASEAKTKMFQAAGTYGVDKTKSVGQGILATLPTSIQGKVISIATDFGSKDIVKKYNATVDSINVVNGIDPKSTNPADHQQIVYAFAKALDPDSAVKEGEYETIKKYAQSAVSKYGKEITNAINGTGFLSEGAIKNIQATMNQTFNSRKPLYENSQKETVRIINNIAGANVANEIMVDYSGGVATPTATANAKPVTEGTVGGGKIKFKVIK